MQITSDFVSLERASQPLPIAITPGDPAGIGPEIVVKAFRDAPEVMRGCFVVGDVALMRQAAQHLGGLLPVAQLASAWMHCKPLCAACRYFSCHKLTLHSRYQNQSCLSS
jgi:4-hydroxy-L-threonine phosphate dehydrogenase PdxA